MATTTIEWTDATWNPTTGCSRVSAGCDHCYAMHFARRFDGQGKGYDGTTRRGKNGTDWTGVVNLHEDRLGIPFRWRKPVRVFVDSMSDLFHPAVPFDFVDRVFAVMALTPGHTYQVLTKRPERAAEYLTRLRVEQIYGHCWLMRERGDFDGALRWLRGSTDVLPNVWIGASVEDQATADERIPHLLRVPAVVRFLSMEPLLGPVDLVRALSGYTIGQTLEDCHGCACHRSAHLYGQGRCQNPGCDCPAVERSIGWVILGGESGRGARPLEIAAVREIVEQCRAAGVPAFVKQLGARPVWSDSAADMRYCHREGRDAKGGDFEHFPEDLRVREVPAAVAGGKTAGAGVRA